MKPETISIIKKVLTYGGIVAAGLGAASDALSKQRKEAEFQEMKKALSELQKMAKESE